MPSGRTAVGTGYCRGDPADARTRENLAGQHEVIAAEARRRGWELIGGLRRHRGRSELVWAARAGFGRRDVKLRARWRPACA